MESMDMGTTTMAHDMMDMMTTTASAAMSTGTEMAMGGMDHDMAGMDHGMDSGPGPACKVSMLWNWDTIDACFFSPSWQITSKGMFAGSCIGVICLVICLEFLRRVGREYDAYILRRHNIHLQIQANASTSSPSPSASSPSKLAATETGGALFSSARNDDLVRPTLFDQLVRATLHMLQFAIAYIAMLLAMYYNGYFIICIFIGAFIGSFIFSWEPLGPGKEIDACGVTKCCG